MSFHVFCIFDIKNSFAMIRFWSEGGCDNFVIDELVVAGVEKQRLLIIVYLLMQTFVSRAG